MWTLEIYWPDSTLPSPQMEFVMASVHCHGTGGGGGGGCLDCTIVVGDLPTDSAGVCRVQSAGHQQPCIFLSLLGVQNAQLPQVPATVTSPSILMMDGLRVRRDPFSSEWLLSDYFTTTKGYEAKIELELIIPEIFLNRGFSFSIPGIHH